MTTGANALVSVPSTATSREAIRKVLSGHMPGLDGVRGLAILLVILHRFSLVSEETLAGRVFGRATDLGWIGVQLFFVLSGFLITGILLDTRESPNYLGSFFGRRVLRIFPLYYGTLLVALVALPLLRGRSEDLFGSPWLWLFLSNWAPEGDPLFSHFWSLAVEEQFYFAWPFLVRALGPRRLLTFCATLIVVAFLARAAMVVAGASPESVYRYTICRMDALAGGAIAAVIMRAPALFERIERSWRQLVGGTLGFTLLVFAATRGAPRTAPTTQTIGYSALVLAFSLLVAALIRAEARGEGFIRHVFGLRPLRTLGKYSYGMYVFHVPIHHFLVSHWPEYTGGREGLDVARGLAYALVASLLTLVAAFVSYQLFERRFLALKSHFVARRA
ncbi:MAG: acyltransferase family protein [Myxococcota bacterium]